MGGVEYACEGFEQQDGDLVAVVTVGGVTERRRVDQLVIDFYKEALDSPNIENTGAIPGMREFHYLQPHEQQEVLALYRHLMEALHGDPYANIHQAMNKPQRDEYDPDLHPKLMDRLEAKSRELVAQGWERGVTAKSLHRKIWLVREQGIDGLIPRSWVKVDDPTVGVHPDVLAAAVRFVDLCLDESTKNIASRDGEFRKFLKSENFDPEVVPAPDRLRRVLRRYEQGQYLDGTVKSRRSFLGRPTESHRRIRVTRPGQVVQIDSTPGNFFAWDPIIGYLSFEIIAAVDIYHSEVVALRVVPGTHSARDLRGLLFDIMRPVIVRTDFDYEKESWAGVPATVVFGKKTVVYPKNVRVDEGEDIEIVGPEGEVAEVVFRPVLPDAVMVDHGRPETSVQFLSACAANEIEVVFARPGKGRDKGHVESVFSVIADLAQRLPGYKGANVGERSEHPEREARFRLQDIDRFLHLWAFKVHNKHVNQNLREPSNPKLRLSPEAKFKLYCENRGYPSRWSMDPSRAFEFLEVVRQEIGDKGVELDGFFYDRKDIWPMWRRRLTQGANGVTEVFYYDRYDRSRIWWRDRSVNRWFAIPMVTYLGTAVEPMSDLRIAAALRIAQTGEPVGMRKAAMEEALTQLTLRWTSHVYLNIREAISATFDRERIRISRADMAAMKAMMDTVSPDTPLWSEPDDFIRHAQYAAETPVQLLDDEPEATAAPW